MTLQDYKHSLTIYGEALITSPEGDPFYALIMAAFRCADTANQAKLRAAWPDKIRELCMRYEAPGGMLGPELAQAEAVARAQARLDRMDRPGQAVADCPPDPSPPAGPTQADRDEAEAAARREFPAAMAWVDEQARQAREHL